MRVCVYEDQAVRYLEPLTLTRAAFDLQCGAQPLLARQGRYFGATELGALVRPGLAAICKHQHPALAVNDFAWMRAGVTVMVNSRWLPQLEPLTDLTPRVALLGDEVAFAILPAEQLTYCSTNTIDDCTETWKQRLPNCQAGGWMLHYPWDLVECIAPMIRQDYIHRMAEAGDIGNPEQVAIVGSPELLCMDPTARIEPFVTIDTTQGPVLIEEGVVVHGFSRLEGPCCIGAHTIVFGAKIRGSSIGQGCRVGGEVEASILHSHSNKYHDGFVGHSYIGSWVNLAAGTQLSDLRHDYQPVRMQVAGRSVDTGMTKVGAFIGDHTKVGVNTLLNTGSMIGAFCNLLPAGGYLPRSIPSFCNYWNGRMEERQDMPELLATAATVMQRRQRELTPSHSALIRALYDHTAAERRRVIRERQMQELRRSA